MNHGFARLLEDLLMNEEKKKKAAVKRLGSRFVVSLLHHCMLADTCFWDYSWDYISAMPCLSCLDGTAVWLVHDMYCK